MSGAAPRPYDLDREVVEAEVLGCHEEARTRFSETFTEELDGLVTALHSTYLRLGEYTRAVEADTRAAWVEALLFYALNSLLTSSHLLCSGLLIPSGNLMRQFGESSAMALLVSHRAIDAYDRLVEDPEAISFSEAIRKVARTRNRELLDIDADSWKIFTTITKWYDHYSHPSALAVASQSHFDGSGLLQLGSGFDSTKTSAYAHELGLRRSACDALAEFIGVAEGHVRTTQGTGAS